jgi:hypothetical protein
MGLGRRLGGTIGVTVMLLLAAGGCGEDEVAQQQQIQAERAEAARIARQDERIRQLEKELDEEQVATPVDSSPSQSTESSEPSGAPVGNSDSWPAGVVGWTVILGSSQTRSAAESIAGSAVSAGLPQVGVLFSSNYSSLNDGYWVTYTGVLGTRSDAVARQDEARASGFTDAYAREVAE